METNKFFRTVGKYRLSDDIAQQIETAIREGRMVPGQALPPERELAQTFNVSRPIIREALRMLEMHGYVTIQQGAQTLIKDPEQDLLTEPVAEWIKNNQQSLKYFYEARQVLEPACAVLACERATEIQLRGMEANLEDSERIAQSGENLAVLVGMDIDFHAEVVEMTGNLYLIKMLDTLIVPETDVRKVLLRLPNHIQRALAGHRRIFEAIKARNAGEARQAMIDALDTPFEVIDQYLDENAKGK